MFKNGNVQVQTKEKSTKAPAQQARELSMARRPFKGGEHGSQSQTKSNHYLGPEPVVMVRSGSKPTAVQALDELLGEEPVQAIPQAERYGFEEAPARQSRRSVMEEDAIDRRSSVSRDRLSQVSRERLSTSQERLSTSRDRISTRSRTPSMDALRTTSQAIAAKYDRPGRLTAQEQAYYGQHGRPLRAGRELFDEDDPEDRKRQAEIRKRANKVWGGRSAWHPMGWLESFWMAVTTRRTCVYVVGLVLGLMLIVGVIVGFLVWPRAPTVRFLDIEHDSSPEPYRLLPKQHGVRVRVQSWVQVEAVNPNYFLPARIKKSSVLANWVMFDGAREMFGGSIIDEERVLKPREKAILRLPITIEYFGTATGDPIYKDFVERCYEGYGDGTIQLGFVVEITTEAKQIQRTGVITVERSMACPMGRDQIKRILDELA